MARGHRIDAVPEVPLVIADAAESITKTSKAVEVRARGGGSRVRGGGAGGASDRAAAGARISGRQAQQRLRRPLVSAQRLEELAARCRRLQTPRAVRVLTPLPPPPPPPAPPRPSGAQGDRRAARRV